MVIEVSYSEVMDVTNSWDALKCIPNAKRTAGELIYSK